MHRCGPRLLAALLGWPAALITGCNKPPEPEPTIVSLLLVSGNLQTAFVGATLEDPLVVRAIDQDGEPVSDLPVNWSVVSGGGTTTPATGITDANGLTSTTFRLGSTIGTQTARAAIVDGSPVVFTATATAAPASQVVIISGDDQTGVVGTQLPVELAVKVTDAFGNPTAGVNVFWVLLIGEGTLSSPTGVSDAAGLAKVRWTLGTESGTQRVAAQILGAVPALFDATATAAPATTITILSGNNQTAPPGAPLPDSLVVRVSDQYENPVRDVSVTWTVTAQNGTVSPSTGRTDALGTASAEWTLGPTGGLKEVRAVVQGLPQTLFQAGATIIFADIMAGGRHTCALDGPGGAAYCWGYNDAGQLGIGSVTPGSLGNLFPNAVVGGNTFSVGSSGASHSCAVTLLSIPHCWGLNLDGRIGNGTNGGTPVSQPAAVVGSNVYKAVTAGSSHTCALTTGGKIYCWGSNEQGQIGVGSAGGLVNSPIAVAPTSNFKSVAAGGLHSCAVDLSGGAWCWGSNAQGQTGHGPGPGPNVPIQVPGLGYEQIVAGESHTCGRQSNGAVQCWGSNASGQLGDGSLFDRNTPVTVLGGLAFASITAGRFHTCGITSAGLAYCWGRGDSGQLGDGFMTDANEPTAVGGGLNFRVISAGGLQTCAITTGSVAYCWGDNTFGALGDGTQESSGLPVKVAFQP